MNLEQKYVIFWKGKSTLKLIPVIAILLCGIFLLRLPKIVELSGVKNGNCLGNLFKKLSINCAVPGNIKKWAISL